MGIAKVVIRARQHLAALMAEKDALVLDLLRFDQELRPLSDYDFPAGGIRKYKISSKEVELAEKLLEGMTGRWSPADYEDEYRDALMKMIRKRIRSGQTEVLEEEEPEEEEAPRTVNFMEVLKESVARQTKPKRAKKSRRAHKSKAG